jgi:hypothetical protein
LQANASASCTRPDGRSNASLHQRCNNQAGGLKEVFSFSVRVRKAVMQGLMLVIVRSTTGHTFGAYVNAPWISANA